MTSKTTIHVDASTIGTHPNFLAFVMISTHGTVRRYVETRWAHAGKTTRSVTANSVSTFPFETFVDIFTHL